MAAHVAAMAPGTNIGSGTPVSMAGAAMDSTMIRKVVHDATAYLESIARQRGRNVDVARAIVEDAANLPADDALAQNVIDLIWEFTLDAEADVRLEVFRWAVARGHELVELSGERSNLEEVFRRLTEGQLEASAAAAPPAEEPAG